MGNDEGLELDKTDEDEELSESDEEEIEKDEGEDVTAYFDLSSYLYLSRLIHDASLIIYELSVPPAHLQHV